MYRSKLHIEVNEEAGEENDITSASAAAMKNTNAATATSLTTTTAAATTTTTTTTTATTTDVKLKSLSLRGNQLCGSILIGNYSHLTYLEVTENEMEILDLSTLAQLVTLKCSNNKLMELMINGKNLNKIMAANNCLHTLTVSPVPTKLVHLNISRNNFTVLPSWVASVASLQHLDAQHNQIQTLMEFCTNYKIEGLQRLDLSYNALRTLPKRLPAAWASLEAVLLHANELQQLPENLFATTWRRLGTLNVSCNRLSALPPPPSIGSMSASTSPTKPAAQSWRLDTLLAASNQLDERIFDVLATCARLRVLHAAYNKIGALSVRHVRSWCALEELVLAGNLLQRLPENLATLQRLQVLRVHSNLLLSLPTNLSRLTQLRVLDVAHNHISHVNLQHLLGKSLKYLDLSCNLQLQVDEQQLKECQAQKHWSFVDVTGKNRTCLPTVRSASEKESPEMFGSRSSASSKPLAPPWSVGFAETPGRCRRLHVAQVHWCNYHVDESCLYGVIDCGADTQKGTATRNTLGTLCKLLPQVLQQEQEREQKRVAKDAKGEYLKQTMLAAQQKLFDDASDIDVAWSRATGGGGITLCHIAKETSGGQSLSARSFVKSQKTKRYVLRVATVGHVGAYLVRKTSSVRLTGQQFESAPPLPPLEQPVAATAIALTEIPLTNEDEYLVLCNSELWTALDVDRVAREMRKEENVVLAAKRLQNIAQSFGADGNLSVLVVRLRNIGTDVDQMIRELKQIVRKKPKPISGMVTARVNNAQRLYERQGSAGALSPRLHHPPHQQLPFVRSERTSPSGQSDHGVLSRTVGDGGGGGGAATGAPNAAESEMELLEETDSVLSEEQFKCWEYMLEQNTQLLFDKELNTISKSFSAKQHAPATTSPPPPATMLHPSGVSEQQPHQQLEHKSNLLKGINNKFLSISSPHLLLQTAQDEVMPYQQQQQQQQQQHQYHHHHHYQQQPPPAAVTPHHKQQLSFLSKYFGSCRSFQATPALAGGCHLAEARQRATSVIGGGPHAAYFGSLQRLMPYNLEYDFAVTRERRAPPLYDDDEHGDFSADGMDDERDDLIADDDDGDPDDDYIAHECRMRKYWGVATTEL